MILHCAYEELTALGATANRVVSAADDGSRVAAPPQALADVASLQPRLHGDLSIATLEEQRSVERAVEYLLDALRDRMNGFILSQHVGSEDSINAYFDYAHVYALLDRVRGVGREMVAMIELMTGEPPTAETARSVTFPDD
ncbi:MAG TPA: hypothetical protein VF039_05625 [Longimicrobiales bacterium]